MQRLLYEYIYVNMWLLLFLAFMWANDGYLSRFESSMLIIVAITGIAITSDKQLRTPKKHRSRD